MKKRIIGVLLAMLPLLGAQAQIVDESGQYVDTLFHDHINRQAEDFVQAYFCVAEPTDWRDDYLGVNGHAFIRLVCDTFNLDFCFSYESDSINNQMNRFLQGKLKMGMYAIPTDEYVKDYQRWNRAVHQYHLNIPPNAEQRLWEIMDNHVLEGNQLKLDLNKRGCSISAVRYIVYSLNDLQIEYPDDLMYKDLTLREIQYRAMENCPWIRLAFDSWLDNVFNQPCEIQNKMIIPQDAATIWQQATLQGKPVLQYDCDIVEAPIAVVNKPLITPLRLAWFLLIVSIVLSLIRYKKPSFKVYDYWMWLWLVVLIIANVVFVYLWLTTKQLPNSSALLLLLFNMGPLVFWHWRKLWQLPYSILLLVSVVVLYALPHMIIDPFYLVIALNYVVLFACNK